MADINVERKGPNIWPWIIGLIVLALLIWWFVSRTGAERGAVPAGTTPDTTVIDTTASVVPAPAGLVALASAPSR